MSITSHIVPAIIPQSYQDLVVQVAKIEGLPEVHVDVVDGLFTPTASWPYLEGSDVTKAYDLLCPFSLEVDLMVADPIEAAQQWLKAGADQLIFHIETIGVEALNDFMSLAPVTVGVAISSATPLEALFPYVPLIDYVQFMSIATIGSQGQPFDESVIDRIKKFTTLFPQTSISIDGSINDSTIKKLTTLGLSRFIVGSAIMGSEVPTESYRTLTMLARN